VARTINDFEEVVLADFEFVSKPGERPDVVCLGGRELRSGRTFCLWRDQLGAAPPYRVDDKALFVCFVANAELGCHLALGWPLPKNVLDLSPEFRCITNGCIVPSGKGLLGALAYYGFDDRDAKLKDAIRKRIIEGWPFTDEEREQILRYVMSDVDALEQLLPKILPQINLALALHRGEFVTASALMEHRGVPIDMEIYPPLADKDTWRVVRDVMVPIIDARYGVYVEDATGNWTFSAAKFAEYLAREGIVWPRLETGKLNMRRKTFEDMSKGHPQLEDLRQLRHARDKMRKVKLAVGADGRNRTVLWPFKSKTSRTQPKAAQWIFSPAVWLRSLVKPGPGQAVAYVDYSSMEFLIAAALSDGHCSPTNTMLDMYKSGDPYLSFAKIVGAAPADATKKSHETLRDRYKTGILAIQYGISAETLAARLSVPKFEAHQMIKQHRELFAQYWAWSDDWLAAALNTGSMRTAFGWACRTGITELNERSIRNWPVQANGADILRIACIMATRRGLELIAPVHDALLLQAPIGRIEKDVALLRDIMSRAGRVVLGNGIELRTDCTIVRYPDRYIDKRGIQMWDRVLELLAEQTATKQQRKAK
jgi:DNA polymerase family A